MQLSNFLCEKSKHNRYWPQCQKNFFFAYMKNEGKLSCTFTKPDQRVCVKRQNDVGKVDPKGSPNLYRRYVRCW